MESPPSTSTVWSEVFLLSDDSGLLLTNSSISSGSSSQSRRNHKSIEFQDSDCDSLDDMSDIMYGENFNTLKKGPNLEPVKDSPPPIEPPLEFQDKPPEIIGFYAAKLAKQLIKAAIYEELKTTKKIRTSRPVLLHNHLLGRWEPFSPCHYYYTRPGSRCSLGSSRLSSSHNSLSVPTALKVDDSSFITQAVSHDTLISDLYNVPFDSDVYAVPIDQITIVKPLQSASKLAKKQKKRRNTSSGCREIENFKQYKSVAKKNTSKADKQYQVCSNKNENKRHSVAGTSAPLLDGEPIHMTLQEVRQYLQTLYSSSSDSSEHNNKMYRQKNQLISKYETKEQMINNNKTAMVTTKKNTFLINIKNKKVKDSSCDNNNKQINISTTTINKCDKKTTNKKTPTKLLSFKQTLCNMFKFRRFLSPEHIKTRSDDKNTTYLSSTNLIDDMHGSSNISARALPPLPHKHNENSQTVTNGEQILDFATSIQKVKDYGWYWGPLSSEAAEKILSNEPDGSFIVRDSSDDHYIFSLTFKLNNCVRHVRIDHDQGNFSFGSCTKFKSQTIVEFIENAVEHSRSGRYLFFLHRRPTIGPVRVQLLNPVSRFKQVQSLQHICRFVIHKFVRRDLIPSLPLPRRMIDYLNTPHYYSEHLIEDTTVIISNNNNNETIPLPLPPIPPIRRHQVQSVPGINNYVIFNSNNNNTVTPNFRQS